MFLKHTKYIHPKTLELLEMFYYVFHKIIKNISTNLYMSAQFIHSNNQSMLWKVINNTPQTISYFANAPIGEKERWFQSIIGHVYNQYNGKNISLKDMNKRAIDFMLQSLVPSPTLQSGAMMSSESLRSLPSESLRSLPSESLRSLPSESLRSLPSESLHLSREQQMHEQFNRRQAEYESMVKKETPVAQFAEGVKDEAILDLDYAVKEYMKQRDQDIEIPPIGRVASNDAPKVSSLSAPIGRVASNDAPKVPLKLDLQNAEPISLIVEELPTKRVQWGENTEHVFDKNESIIDTASACLWQKDISEIKTKLDLIISLLRER
jgi:hypothetical protein